MPSFVDFSNVWLAYNNELLAKKQFAVEDISMKIGRGEFIHPGLAGHEGHAPCCAEQVGPSLGRA